MGNQFLWLSGNRLATQQLGTTDRGQMQICKLAWYGCYLASTPYQSSRKEGTPERIHSDAHRPSEEWSEQNLLLWTTYN